MAAIDPSLMIRSTELAVSDLPRSVEFYEQLLGLPLISRGESRAELGRDAGNPALVLSAIEDPTSIPPGSTGLFHVAWLHPSRAALAGTARRVSRGGWPFDGVADHGVSEALYLSDPDGLGIEIYADRPREQWARPAGGGLTMVTLPLDVGGLLEEAPEEPAPEIAPGTRIGHVHLQVSDVPRAEAFYAGALGFETQARLPSAAFVSAGGYHHHIGINSWRSRGARPAPDSAPGLRQIEFALSGPPALRDLRGELAGTLAESVPAREDVGTLAVRDPDGVLLLFAAR